MGVLRGAWAPVTKRAPAPGRPLPAGGRLQPHPVEYEPPADQQRQFQHIQSQKEPAPLGSAGRRRPVPATIEQVQQRHRGPTASAPKGAARGLAMIRNTPSAAAGGRRTQGWANAMAENGPRRTCRHLGWANWRMTMAALNATAWGIVNGAYRLREVNPDNRRMNPGCPAAALPFQAAAATLCRCHTQPCLAPHDQPGHRRAQAWTPEFQSSRRWCAVRPDQRPGQPIRRPPAGPDCSGQTCGWLQRLYGVTAGPGPTQVLLGQWLARSLSSLVQSSDPARDAVPWSARNPVLPDL